MAEQAHKRIKVLVKAEVPAGDYCIDYRGATILPPDNKCAYLDSQTSKVGWEDGLGSPGFITHYNCGLFNIFLSSTQEKGEGMYINKCEACRECSYEQRD